MQLRDYQQDAYDQVRQSIIKGKKRPIVAAGCSFGKTILAGAICKSAQDKGKKFWFFADRVQLIEQTIEKFKEFGIVFGVRQANHPLKNPHATIQIASIQTIAAMLKRGYPMPEFDGAIVDECHTQYKVIDHIMELFNAIPIIGLTATPYSKGLGIKYNNLIVPITPRELLDRDFLCPIRYFGGEHIDMKKIRSAGPNEYNSQDVSNATNEESEYLAGCIVKNWLKLGENSQTIAFSPTQDMSKALVDKLILAGISAQHIDCHTDKDDRSSLFNAHDRGEFKVLSCSRLLNTGYDAPSVRCVIDCYPIKSVTDWVQRVGRLQRSFKGKEYAIYLDHASNYDRFGPAEDIIPYSLDDGSGTHSEKNLTNQKDKKEPKTQDCPKCNQKMIIPACKACGYTLPVDAQVFDDGAMLVELQAEQDAKDAKKANRSESPQMKQKFLSELYCHAEKKGYKRGWAANQYRERFGVWPNKIKHYHVHETTDILKGWLTHQRIKFHKGKKA